MKDRELILFPVLSGMGLLVLGFAGLAAGIAETGNLFGFLVLILIAYFITTFFNAALISAALEKTARWRPQRHVRLEPRHQAHPPHFSLVRNLGNRGHSVPSS